VDELVGSARVMREMAVPVAVTAGLTVIDTCGAGGTGSTFFNISTAAALVAAGAGRPLGVAVAKHGNRSVTSRSGSSNVLEQLGVNLQPAPEVLTRCLDEAGMCFCFAPAHHPAMKHAGPVRASLGFRTIFNLVGPLTNPAGARRQLIGVPSPAVGELIAEALLRLDAERCLLVNSVLPDGRSLGELTTFGPTQAAELRHGQIKSYPIDPAALGLPFALPGAVTIESPAESASLVMRVLDNEAGPARDIVVLNAAAALLVADAAESLAHGLELAAAAIAEGAAKRVLDQLVTLTNA
jgi:anthranilate phosphoribosyltransferase